MELIYKNLKGTLEKLTVTDEEVDLPEVDIAEVDRDLLAVRGFREGARHSHIPLPSHWMVYGWRNRCFNPAGVNDTSDDGEFAAG